MCGVYPDADVRTAGEEISSTYEGRHLTFLESELIHPSHTDGFVDKGDPVVVGAQIVGVAFDSASAATDLIPIDSEGIWAQSVVAEDDDGNSAVAAGDELYINITTCIISKISNSVTNIPFGMALGVIGAGETAVIAVKVHFDPSLTGGIADLKGFDHVQGTTANPIAWGVDGNHIKSMVFEVGILTDYINANRIHMLTTDDITAGGVYNIYSRQDVKHDIQNMIGIHALGYVTPDTPAALTINQILGISGQVYINNPGNTITLGDQISAGRFTMDQSLTSVVTGTVPAENGWINGVFVYMNGIEHDNSGKAAGVHVCQGGGVTSFPDYAIYILQESENALAAMKIESKAIGMFGIEFESALGFGFTSMIRYAGGAVAANCQYFLQFDNAAGAEGNTMVLEDETNNDADADFAIRVRLAGDSVDRVIRLYEA